MLQIYFNQLESTPNVMEGGLISWYLQPKTNLRIPNIVDN